MLGPTVTEVVKGLVDILKSNGVDTQEVSTAVSQVIWDCTVCNMWQELWNSYLFLKKQEGKSIYD